MKYFSFLTIGLTLLFMSCNSAPENKNDGYTISGTVPGVYDGVRAYLKIVDNQRREMYQDTAIVFNEKFTFKGQIDSPELWHLSINGIEGMLPVFIENKDLTVTIDSKSLNNSSVSGSKSNDALTTYSKRLRTLSEKQNSLIIKNRDLTNSGDTEAKSKIATEISEVNQELTNLPMTFLTEHPDNYFSLVLLESLINAPNADIEAIEKRYNAIGDAIKSSDIGKSVFQRLEAKKIQMARLNSLNIGQMAPDFTAPNTNGESVALNDIKGKVTIIDFWASWCGPCRRENPNVVKTYKKYHDKGLEIIGVSLDRPDQKDRWLKAIKDDQLDWHHVSHLNYFNDPVAQLYNITSIPATFILDASGKIVAKNLRGDALEKKIAELLD